MIALCLEPIVNPWTTLAVGLELISELYRARRKPEKADKLVKNAADAQSPLLTASERVDRAIQTLTSAQAFTSEQLVWIERIRTHLQGNLSIDQDDFESQPIFSDCLYRHAQAINPSVKKTTSISWIKYRL